MEIESPNVVRLAKRPIKEVLNGKEEHQLTEIKFWAASASGRISLGLDQVNRFIIKSLRARLLPGSRFVFRLFPIGISSKRLFRRRFGTEGARFS